MMGSQAQRPTVPGAPPKSPLPTKWVIVAGVVIVVVIALTYLVHTCDRTPQEGSEDESNPGSDAKGGVCGLVDSISKLIGVSSDGLGGIVSNLGAILAVVSGAFILTSFAKVATAKYSAKGNAAGSTGGGSVNHKPGGGKLPGQHNTGGENNHNTGGGNNHNTGGKRSK
jgi:hypothetical protein